MDNNNFLGAMNETATSSMLQQEKPSKLSLS
jgi:hypothetical protein